MKGRFAIVISLVAFALLAGIALTASGTSAATPSSVAGQATNPTAKYPVFQAHPDKSASAPAARVVSITSLDSEIHEIDMGKLGIRPLDHPLPLPKNGTNLLTPDGGAVGIGAFMSVSPDVVSQSTTSAIATLSTDFTPAENVDYYLNGALAATFPADASGRLSIRVSTGAGEGFITIRAVGQTSGKQAGGVAQVLDNALKVPGVAVGPHAVSSVITSTIYMFGVRYPPGTSVSLARNTTSLGTVTSNATDGRFLVSITLVPVTDTSEVFNSSGVTITTGSMAGQSIERRADAGPPPGGDQNVSRVLVDRAVLDSAVGGTFTMVGEGFQAGETVNVSGCAAGTVPADANGSVGIFLTAPAGAGVYNCVFTGATSGRIGRGSVLAASTAANVPSAINQPATVSGAGDFVFLFSKVAPNQSGTVYMDGISQTIATSNAGGFGAAVINNPTGVIEHEVAWFGDNGQVAIAPLMLVPSGPTATPTSTVTGTPPTLTPTSTSTFTPTPTITPTPICPGSWTQQTVYPVNVLDEAITSHAGNLYSFSGVVNGAIAANSYKYDAGTNTWTAIAPLPGAREKASAVSDGTYIYILNGADTTGSNTGTLYRYDPVSDTYTTLASDPNTTWAQTAEYLGGKIYRIAGCGANCASFVNTVDIYDIATNTWTSGAPYPLSIGFLMSTTLNGFVYAGGGVNAAESTKTYRYDPTAGTWDDAAIADLPATRWGAASGPLKGKWFLAGGYVNGSVSATSTRWDSVANVWETADPFPLDRARTAGGPIGVAFYVVGGRGPSDPNAFQGHNENQRYINGCQPTPTATATATPTCPPVTVQNDINNFAFNPPSMTINVGTTVRWTNLEAVTHTSTSDSPLWDSGNLSQNQSFSYTFNSVGTYTYHCTVHPFMTGTINVVPGCAPAGVITGHLTWQTVPQPNARNVQTATLTLCNAGVPASFVANIDASGFFTVPTGYPNGNYNWWIKGERHLANAGTLTIAGGVSAPEMGTMRGGDAIHIGTSDNLVDSADFNNLRAFFGIPSPPDLRSDFDFTGLVDAADFNILRANFGIPGAPHNCP